MKEKSRKLLQLLLPYILAIGLIVSQVIMWNAMQSAKKELEEYKRLQNTTEVIDTINTPVSNVKDHENVDYPRIDRNIESINKNIKKTDSELKKAKNEVPDKEKIYEEFKQKNISEINEYFNSVLTSPSAGDGTSR